MLQSQKNKSSSLDFIFFKNGIIYSFFMSLMYFPFNVSAQSFSYGNNVYAESCDNPSLVVKWIMDGSGKWIHYRLNISEGGMSKWTVGRITINNEGIFIRYKDVMGIIYPNREDELLVLYSFDANGYRVKQNWIGNSSPIENFILDGRPVPRMLNCAPGSLADLKFNEFQNSKKLQDAMRLKQVMENLKQEELNLRKMCVGRPKIDQAITERISNGLRVMPNSISVNRVELSPSNRSQVACNATIYHAKGVCKVQVSFNKAGQINYIYDDC